MKQSILLILMGMLWINFAFCQPIIHIWGTADSLAVRNQVVQHLDYLDVREDVYVSVGFTPDLSKKMQGVTFYLNLSGASACPIIKVLIDSRMSSAKQKLVLAHEMIHVKQYVKGELLVLNKRQVLWKGRKHNYQPDNRQKAPWELEAYKKDNLLAKRCKLPVESPLVASVENR